MASEETINKDTPLDIYIVNNIITSYIISKIIDFYVVLKKYLLQLLLFYSTLVYNNNKGPGPCMAGYIIYTSLRSQW